MIYVRIELWPGGDGQRRKLLGEAVIANDGTGTAAVASYDAAFSRRGGFGPRDTPGRPKIWRAARVEGFRRNRVGAVWDLLRLAVASAMGVGS